MRERERERERERGERDKARLSRHHECQVVTFFVPNFCKLSTSIIITNTVARAGANWYVVT